MAVTNWNNYVLTRADIEHIESSIKELPGESSFCVYKRVYAGRLENDHYVVTGVFIKSKESGVEIVSPANLPLIFDGGCDVITVKYDFQTKTVLSIFCNGDS